MRAIIAVVDRALIDPSLHHQKMTSQLCRAEISKIYKDLQHKMSGVYLDYLCTSTVYNFLLFVAITCHVASADRSAIDQTHPHGPL